MTAGIVVWFTGLPASGKTTLASQVAERLAPRIRCVRLDSDELHDALGAHAYAHGDRDAFYSTLGRLAGLLADQGHVVLVAATAARRAYREQARARAARFLEVHVQTPLGDCEARDIKGLYARARAGEAPTLPGVGVPYEPPVDPDVTADGGRDAGAARDIERRILVAIDGAPDPAGDARDEPRNARPARAPAATAQEAGASPADRVQMPPTSLLVPIDFSACSEHALDYACSLGAKLGATIHLVHALGGGLPELTVTLTDAMRAQLRSGSLAELEKLARARASIATFGQVIVDSGDARDAIVASCAAIRADLVVIGSHGRRGLSRWMLGSVAESIVRTAPCPVLVIRAPRSDH